MTDTSPRTSSPHELWSGSGLRPELLVVDVRTPAEFGEVHVPSAINLPLGDLPARAEELKGHADGRRVALVCRTGQRAGAACEKLAQLGWSDVRVLEGGIEAWIAAGLPVERGAKAMSLERQVRVAAGSLVLLGVALGFAVHPAFFGLAAFVGAGLVFAGVTDTCGMAMLLARMPWNRARPTCSTPAHA